MSRTPDEPGDDRIRLPWTRSGSAVPSAIVRPIQVFMDQEISSGVLLLAATLIAVIWANTRWSASYHTLWATPVGFGIGSFELFEPLGTWISEPLLGLFFMVVGLELKREQLTGELRDRRTLAVPAVAALAGMAVPALLYLAIAGGTSGAAKGWAIPMATDVPFALGLLAIAGRGLPPVLRIFLLTLAIVDDIASLLVIGLFYSGHVRPIPFAIELIAMGLMWLSFRLRLQVVGPYAVMAAVVLIAAMRSGLHATLAGFVLGLLVPATPFQRPAAVSAEAHRIADETLDDPQPPDADAEAWLSLAALSRQAVSPLARVEGALHPWTSLVIVPVFALANAGVILRGSLVTIVSGAVFMGVLFGRIVGKAVGIPLGAFAASGIGLGRRPDRIGGRELLAIGGAAGLGFTVPLLVIDLAFPPGSLADQAKAGLLAASAAAALIGAALMAFARRGAARRAAAWPPPPEPL